MGEKTDQKISYMCVLKNATQEGVQIAHAWLKKNGVRLISQYDTSALVVLATSKQIKEANDSKIFMSIEAGTFDQKIRQNVNKDQLRAIDIWNSRHTEGFIATKSNRKDSGKSWNAQGKASEPPHTRISSKDFQESVLNYLGINEKDLFAKYQTTKIQKAIGKLDGEPFEKYEQKLAKHFGNPSLAYELARQAYHLGPLWKQIILDLPPAFADFFFNVFREVLFHQKKSVTLKSYSEPSCWMLQDEISVGIVFVESSNGHDQRFDDDDRDTIEAEITDGIEWLAEEAPDSANLSWILNWLYVTIDVPNGDDNSDEQYWRDSAIAKVNYNSRTYSAGWNGVRDFRNDMRLMNQSAHAIVIFVTAYSNSWHAYAGNGRVTLANRHDWGGWGIDNIDTIVAHEILHLFGSADEYSGNGTPCSSCVTNHGCYSIPNGNCHECASHYQPCVMDQNSRTICPWTRAQIGWTDGIQQPPFLRNVEIHSGVDGLVPFGFGQCLTTSGYRGCPERYVAIWGDDGLGGRRLNLTQAPITQSGLKAYLFLGFGPFFNSMFQDVHISDVKLVGYDSNGHRKEIQVSLIPAKDPYLGTYYWGIFDPAIGADGDIIFTLNVDAFDEATGNMLDQDPTNIGFVIDDTFINYTSGIDVQHKITIQKAIRPDGYEVNDTFDTAKTIGCEVIDLTIHSPIDSDYFQIIYPAIEECHDARFDFSCEFFIVSGSDASLCISVSDNELDLDFSVFKSDRSFVQQFTNSGSISRPTSLFEDRKPYICIRNSQGYRTHYKLSVVLNPPTASSLHCKPLRPSALYELMQKIKNPGGPIEAVNPGDLVAKLLKLQKDYLKVANGNPLYYNELAKFKMRIGEFAAAANCYSGAETIFKKVAKETVNTDNTELFDYSILKLNALYKQYCKS